MQPMPSRSSSGFRSTGQRGGRDAFTHTESLHPDATTLKAGHDSLKFSAKARQAYNKCVNPVIGENLERLLALKRDLCCVDGCKRKHIYWTPNGVYCGAHRDEAMSAMREAKVKRYGQG